MGANRTQPTEIRRIRGQSGEVCGQAGDVRGQTGEVRTSRGQNGNALISSQVINRVGQEVRGLRQRQDSLLGELRTDIERETKPELEQLRAAMLRYEEKLQAVMKRDDLQRKEQQLRENTEKLGKLLQQIGEAYQKAVQHIWQHADDPREAARKCDELGELVEEAIFNEDERQILRKVKEQIKKFLGNDRVQGQPRLAFIQRIP
ncbi:MAG: hypothetical protein ACYCOU_06385 [Sulfobacillus sp.]